MWYNYGMNTIWKKIPGFSRYEASNTGKIRSLNYKNSGKIHLIHPCLSGGYFKTMLLSDSGKYKTWNVHKWVAMTFLGENVGMEINHKSGNKKDNSLENIEYLTRSQNIQHAYDHGLLSPKRGSMNGMAKLTEEQVKIIRETARTGGRFYGRKTLALRYGVSECQIKGIVNRRRDIWPHV
jgi:hypothetical protein